MTKTGKELVIDVNMIVSNTRTAIPKLGCIDKEDCVRHQGSNGLNKIS